VSTDYAFDLHTPVGHVATELGGAASAALSVSEMVASYTHPNLGDLARIRQHEGRESDQQALVWLIEQALVGLEYSGKTTRSTRQVESDGNGGFRLVVAFDDLLYEGRKIRRREPDLHAELHDPFDPMSGEFSANIRKLTGKDSMDGLRESMRELGWIEHLPAIKDERDVVIMGHRRLTVAAELGIEPVVKTVTFGNGDAGDADRFKLAIASNLDAKPFTPDERKRIAEYLYGEHEWTMARTAEALNVSTATVGRDVAAFSHDEKRKTKRGRPRKLTPEQDEQVVAMTDEGLGREDIAEKLGTTENQVQRARERELGARRERQKQVAEPTAGATCTCPSCGHVH
jgi:ParB-like chromosome segregation protein Spo0J